MSAKEKRKYNQWSEENMKEAITKYKTGKYGLNQICRLYDIPKPTFKRHINSTNVRANEGYKALGRCSVFSPELERQLKDHILTPEETFYGVSIKDIRKAAFELAERNHIKHSFNNEKRIAGKKWFYNFMRRHRDISLRQPESTSLARCKGFNRENVFGFFDILEKTVDEHMLDATKIFNVDESGFSIVQKKCQKVLAQRGKHQVRAVASGERGVNTTMVVCCSAAGQYVAPMIIFKRKRMMAELGTGAPPGCLVEISDSGYINSDLFVKWLQQFINAVKPTKENKVLLVLDGHTTHSKNFAALEIARDNGVIMLQLPGHTTHRLQPLDVAVFKPLETYYNQAVERWMRVHPGLAVTQFQVAELLREAYGKAATIANSVNGFRKCGIWPVNRHVLSDVDFAASNALRSKENQDPIDAQVDNENVESDSSTEESSNDSDDNVPLATIRNKKLSSSKPTVSIEEVLPFPKVSDAQNVRRTRGAQEAQILTSTQYKEELQLKQTSVTETKKRAVKRKLDLHKPSTSKTTPIDDIQNWHCHFFNKCVVEDMIQCKKCQKWVHESCANIISKKDYKCDFCS